MKNYYYFLGVSEDAPGEDIKKAYRKLSLKYHPDRNPDDEFFANRFRETKEAYEVLVDPDRRTLYNKSLAMAQRTTRSPLPPIIRQFTSSKIRVSDGEEVILKWHTENADVVKILPFGLDKASGERVFKITKFVDGKFNVVLHATNTLVNKTIVQGITITQVSDRGPTDREEAIRDLFQKPMDSKTSERRQRFWPYLILLLLLSIIVYLASTA